MATATPSIERIRVQRVVRAFGSTLALRGVSAELRRGAITTLEGPNGAGKTTLLSILGTLLRPSSGVVDYEPLGRASDSVRGQIGWLGHESLCYRDLSGRENLRLAARLHGVDPGAVDAAVERVAAQGFIGRPLHTLSRGQRQRVALARALVNRPSVLLLDEPSTGLDARSVEQLEQVLHEERDRGTLIVMVSHSRGLASRLADQRIRLERGRRVKDADGSPNEPSQS